ncbi:MAG: transglutaminase family protein [Lachnospiraceae bacterium]|nr:transglutaminase family protein [Lachnospiraceae bacterium]
MSRETMLQYLENSKYIDFDNAEVRRKARELRNVSSTEIELIQSTYYFVRDEIKHSWDVQDKRVTVSASDVLREGVGICWAKSNLFAALLRANGVPCGFSHQRLTLGDTPDTGYCIHSLNTVYVSALDKWIRLDARGNTDKIHAEFSLEEEVLAFHVIPENDEYDYHDNLARPVEALMQVLEENTDALYMYQYCLPGRL